MNIDKNDVLAEEIVKRLSLLQTDGTWSIGKIITETLELSQAKSQIAKVCRSIVSHPTSNFSYAFLRECIRTYSYYPDIADRKLPEALYHILANRVYRHEDREHFEQEAIRNQWNASQLTGAIRQALVSRKEREKSQLGFDLQLRNIWYFNSADPRFGKPSFRGRIAGQIVANALYYFANSHGLIVDLFAGSGTLGDVIGILPYFAGREYIMYDLVPSDERILQNDVTIQGIPLPSSTVHYVFLDPPYSRLGERYYSKNASDLSMMAPQHYLAVMHSVIRECKRVLTPGCNVSLLIEPIMPFDGEFLDLPFALSRMFVDEGFTPISKVYVPNQTMRNEGSMPNIIAHSRLKKKLISDCRELLTFRKPTSANE